MHSWWMGVMQDSGICCPHQIYQQDSPETKIVLSDNCTVYGVTSKPQIEAQFSKGRKFYKTWKDTDYNCKVSILCFY